MPTTAHTGSKGRACCWKQRASLCTVQQDKRHCPGRGVSPGPYRVGGLPTAAVLAEASEPSRAETVLRTLELTQLTAPEDGEGTAVFLPPPKPWRQL